MPTHRAEMGDLDALVRLEDASFTGDRISRRGFRHFLRSGTGRLLVTREGEHLAGYILLLLRKDNRRARIYSICVDHAFRGRGIAESLIMAGESTAREAGCTEVRLEVRRDNPAAIQLYRKLGFRPIGEVPAYYDDGETALRFEKRINDVPTQRTGLTIPYYNQTTRFSCGSACLMMAMSALQPERKMSRWEELRIWREATTIYMTSGHGGCGPHGLAVAAHRRGFAVEIHLNRKGVLFSDGMRDRHKKDVVAEVHADFIHQLADIGIVPRYRPLGIDELRGCLARGAIPIVLISAFRLSKEKTPHWAVVTGVDDKFVYIHDSALRLKDPPEENMDMAIERTTFARMARFGQAQLRAALVISRRTN